MNRTDNYYPNYIVRPGATLLETLESLHMSQTELAKRTSRPEKTISEIINGLTAITPETAIQFERALGVQASFWNNLEKNYQEQKARIDADKKLEEEVVLLTNFPYNIMAKLGWIKQTSDRKEQVKNLLSYFSVNSLNLINNVMQINYRKHNGKNASQGAVATWLRKGEIDGINLQTKPFNEKELKQCLNNFKTLSKSKIQDFAPILISQLADCGVALVFTHDLPKTYVCGASRWLSPSKALVQLSMRGRFADIMWFTLYHELGHLLLHSKKERFIDVASNLQTTNVDEIENQANNFSSESLIPSKQLDEFLRNNTVINRSSIVRFASQLDIHPGILVGRLQHEKVLDYNQENDLRAKYVWVNGNN